MAVAVIVLLSGRHSLCEEGGGENGSREPRDDNQDGGAAAVQRHLGQGAEEAQDDQAGEPTCSPGDLIKISLLAFVTPAHFGPFPPQLPRT